MSCGYYFPQFPGGSRIVYHRGSGAVEGVGGFESPQCSGASLLFPPLVSSSQGKVVSAVLGMPPPSFEAHGIEKSLITDRDEESVLSDNYSDHHSVNVDCSTTWGRPTVQISDRELKSHTTERKDKDSHRSSEKDCEKNRDRSKKGDSQRITEWSCSHSLLCRDHRGDHTSNGKHERSCGQESPSDIRKNKQRHGRSTSPSCNCKKSCTPEGQPLPPPPIFHSTPLPLLHRLSSDLPEPSSAHLSFNQSQSLLPSLELGGGYARSIYSVGAPIQRGTPSVVGPLLPSTSIAAVNFSEDHIKQIFSFACERRHLKEHITREFIRLSSQEVLFHTQVQSTGHESLASRHPDHFTTYYEIL